MFLPSSLLMLKKAQICTEPDNRQILTNQIIADVAGFFTDPESVNVTPVKDRKVKLYCILFRAFRWRH